MIPSNPKQHSRSGTTVELSESFVRLIDSCWNENPLGWTRGQFKSNAGFNYQDLKNWNSKRTAAAGKLAEMCQKIQCDPKHLLLSEPTSKIVRGYCNSELRWTPPAEKSAFFIELFGKTARKLEQVLENVLSRCDVDGYLTWIKPVHGPTGLLYDGVVRAQCLDQPKKDLLRHLVFNPAEWDHTCMKKTEIANCRNWLAHILPRWNLETKERNAAYIAGLTNSVASEIYIPISLSTGGVVACLNIHFAEERHEKELLDYSDRVAESINRDNPAEEIVEATNAQLNTAKGIVSQLSASDFQSLENTLNTFAEGSSSFPRGRGEKIEVGEAIRNVLDQEKLAQQFLVKACHLPPPIPLKLSAKRWSAVTSVAAGVANSQALTEVLRCAFHQLSSFGSFEVTYGHISGTPLVHITISHRRDADQDFSRFANLLKDFEGECGRMTAASQFDLDASIPDFDHLETRFDFLYAACILSRVSCGHIRIAQRTEFEWPAIRIEFPRAALLPHSRPQAASGLGG